MPHPKQHITDLAEICYRKGVRSVVISPGSRSAPLIKAFYSVFEEKCISIVDERSAAYFALGLALYTQIPVVLICTSGTAVLNYAPALAEAYYQHVPLIAVTADRPREWIDQQDNQTLRQSGIYRNFIRGSFELPQVITSEDEVWYAHRIINEAVDLSVTPSMGPVHINVPLTEPLYDELPPPSERIRIILSLKPDISVKLPVDLIREWQLAQRIMILHGQDNPGSPLSSFLPSFSSDERIIVMAENIANVSGNNVISNSNLLLVNSRNNGPACPDLILHSGGQVVSKALTGFLRRAGNASCWRIGTDNSLIDTFKQVTRSIPLPANALYRALSEWSGTKASVSYRDIWLETAAKVNDLARKFIRETSFSDLRAMNRIFQLIPAGTNLVLGNSSIIRYSQIFPVHPQVKYFANRGVSGIDGSLSTAAGIAFAAQDLTLAIAGDLGFLYDSNALWNRKLPSNLRILVINNGGGGIFHILKGPSDQPGFKNYIEANHPVNLEKLAGAYGLDYYFADNEPDLDRHWDAFIQGQGRTIIFEVKTDAAISAAAFRQLMRIPL
jgi:2-succinyl-5-enolpyruvyl-6-hydroxy-3-cyclohexene-1-carboxylate synthase